MGDMILRKAKDIFSQRSSEGREKACTGEWRPDGEAEFEDELV